MSRQLKCAGSAFLQTRFFEVSLAPLEVEMRGVRTMFGVSLLMLFAFVYVDAQGNTNPVLNKLAADFMIAFNARDATKVASFYAEDAVLMPPNATLIKGRAAIEAFFKSEFSIGVTGLKLTPIESVISGSIAFEAGTSVVTIGRRTAPTLTGAGTTTDNGKYLTTFKRVGNEWKIAYDIFNSDQPKPK